MRGATLFSGIGAPEIAAPEIDWIWHAEIDAFPSAVMAHHHGTPNLGDVTADDFIERAKQLGPIDILVAGSPCQSFSVAGKRLGLDDPRGNLALVTLRICEQLRPRWIVFENVPGLLTSGKGDDFAAFLDQMEECGYSGAWRVLDAQYAGVAQRRRRVFAVGHFGDDWRPAAAVLFEPASLCGDTPPSRQAREEIAGAARPSAAPNSRWPAKTACTLNTKFGDKMGLEDQHINGDAPLFVPMLSSGQANATVTTDGTSPTLTCLNDQPVVAFDTYNQETSSNVSKTLSARKDRDAASCIAFGANNSASQGISASADITPTLSTTKVPAVAGSHWDDANNPHPTLTSKTKNSGGIAMSNQEIFSQRGGGLAPHLTVRRLTPRECERLQGFPDDFTLIPYRHGKPAADGPRYKALGNSMAVPVVGWVLSRIRIYAFLPT